tara:strand:- start:399 stop:815 length:417 start_codon:yes stop_codon:yes gene_type:complete
MKKTTEKKSECKDINCPFHGGLKTRGRSFVGTVISTKMQKTITIEWEWRNYLRKYERYEKRRGKLKAHNPACINAKEGEIVKVVECRPISKTKNFVVISIVGKEKGFEQRMEAEEEAKVKKDSKKDDDGEKPIEAEVK